MLDDRAQRRQVGFTACLVLRVDGEVLSRERWMTGLRGHGADRSREPTPPLRAVRPTDHAAFRLDQKTLTDSTHELLRRGVRKLEGSDGEHIDRQLLLRRKRA